jgi:hypothetical protein
VESHLDLFLATLELTYQRMRTHGLWGPKIDPGIMDRIDANGITLERCPRCVDLKEKNVAWLLWALILQNQKVRESSNMDLGGTLSRLFTRSVLLLGRSLLQNRQMGF